MPRAPTDNDRERSKRGPSAKPKSTPKAAARKAAPGKAKARKTSPEYGPSPPQQAPRRGADGGGAAKAQAAKAQAAGRTQSSATEHAPAGDQRPTITTILWTIYLNPADAPGQAVLRPHACLRDGRVLAGTRSWIRPTVADCRALIPKSAKRLNVADPDKTIQEVWMQTMGSGTSAGDQTGR